MPLDPNMLAIGAGWLYAAALGSTEPSDLATPWDAAWVQLGYTAEGHQFTIEETSEGIEVAEVLGPVRQEKTGRNLTVEFALAEITVTNLTRAMNGGLVTAGAGFSTVEPPTIDDAVVHLMLGWEAFEADERVVWRKCQQTGSVGIQRRKAPTYATIPTTFTVLEPGGATRPFKFIESSARAGT